MPTHPDPVLEKLKRRQPCIVEWNMVRAPDTLDGERRHAHVAEGLHPGGERPSHALVVLEIDPAIRTSAIVLIEIHRELFVLRFCPFLRIPKVGKNILSRSVKALFFAAPERYADRASRLNANCLENADCLQRDRTSGSIVASTRLSCQQSR